MLLFRICCLLALCLLSEATVVADPPHRHGGSGYPHVIGPSGRAYGPTMSHYQYERRYGRPWHGGGSVSFGSSSRFPSSANFYIQLPFGFPYGYGYTAYDYDYGYGYPYVGNQGQFFYPQFAPNGYLNYPNSRATIVDLPIADPVVVQPNDVPDFPPGEVVVPVLKNPAQRDFVVRRSSDVQRERSRRFQVRGDKKFSLTDYLGASADYQSAISEASDLGDPRYRFAISLAARSRFDEAVEEMKRATQVDPAWTWNPLSLHVLFGPNNAFEEERVKTRVAEWAARDIRDPNRLFLLGAMLYLDQDPRSQELLEAAERFGGQQHHITAFLAPQSGQVPPPGRLIPDPIDQVVPPPQPAAEPVEMDDSPELIPPVPADVNRGEIIGAERDLHVFERSRRPSLPDSPKSDPPLIGPELPPLP